MKSITVVLLAVIGVLAGVVAVWAMILLKIPFLIFILLALGAGFWYAVGRLIKEKREADALWQELVPQLRKKLEQEPHAEHNRFEAIGLPDLSKQ